MAIPNKGTFICLLWAENLRVGPNLPIHYRAWAAIGTRHTIVLGTMSTIIVATRWDATIVLAIDVLGIH